MYYSSILTLSYAVIIAAYPPTIAPTTTESVSLTTSSAHTPRDTILTSLILALITVIVYYGS